MGTTAGIPQTNQSNLNSFRTVDLNSSQEVTLEEESGEGGRGREAGVLGYMSKVPADGDVRGEVYSVLQALYRAQSMCVYACIHVCMVGEWGRVPFNEPYASVLQALYRAQSMCVYACIHICVYTYMCVYICVYTCVYTYRAQSMCVYVCIHVCMCMSALCACMCASAKYVVGNVCKRRVGTFVQYLASLLRGGGLGSRPKKMYGERLGDGVEYHLMSPTPRR